MPRNGSGTYQLPAGNPVVTNTTISSAGWANPTLSDIAAALSASIAVDGQTVPTANLPMGNFRHLQVANGQNTNEYATVGQIQTAGFQLLGGTAGTINTTKSITTTAAVTTTGSMTANDLTLTGGGVVTKGRSYFNITTGAGELAMQNTSGGYFYMRGRNPAGGGMEWVNNAYSTVVASMDDGGNFTATGLTASSDRRLKSHIKIIRNATDVVLAWVGVTFQRKGDKTKRRHAGFVADEMIKSAPELVFEDERGFKSIAYGNASAYLAAAFAELEARVCKLESKK